MSGKKKIIFSSYDDLHNPFYAGGGALAVHEIASRCVPSFDITVITGNYKGAKNETVDGVHYKRIGPSFLGPKISQLIFSSLLPLYVKKETYDIWIESFTPPFSTACLQMYTKKPVIGLVHMLAGRDMQRKYHLPFHRFEEKGLKTYNTFIVLRESTKRKIAEINKHAQIFVIPNGVDTVEESNDQVKNRDILFLGRLEYNQKGLDLLLDAYHKIASRITSKLIIAGSGSEGDEKLIRDKIQEYGLTDKILMVGKIAGKEKDTLLRNAALVVVPSRFETFSLVALEAMSYGKPIVNFAIQGLDWISPTCGLQVKPFDTTEFGEAMYTILHDSKRSAQMAAAGRTIAKQYSWEKIVEQYRDVFTTVLAKP